ncbi:DUF2793 domain-containing protein [Mesobacterium sp. TK19101]|uniref:DUF2793 domain-containing protein n=1 Tax=Mesobacterium hydrothermale TaxID=3111907 RepID=A0ABU6HCY9_9RHOB|nr:DUF2793 domain-containing protein [Mesobacterium sp. TK19101]MEC3860141.1 DUF2793 domain-containing protein [Mesobacterium sp. TK19101]
MTTPNLALPYIAAAQAQKHVTHNEALDRLDGLVQLSVKDRDLTAPPASPAEGDRYIVATGATGAWAGWDGDVALFSGGAWVRLAPQTGWRVWIEDEAVLLVFDGTSWIGVTPDALQGLTRLGLGTTADAANPFSAKLNGALWTALTAVEGGNGDLRVTLNKETAAGVLSFLFQSGFSGRAELGLLGSDDLSLKVSPDGTAWRDALIIDCATGIVDQPQSPRFKAYTNYDNYVALTTWTKIGINTVEANDQGGFDPATNLFTAPVAGTYLFGASLLYKVNASTSARMRGRLVLNGTTEIRGSFGEVSSAHKSLATALWLQTMVPLTAGDTVELQGYFRAEDGYFAADHTSFWGAKVG